MAIGAARILHVKVPVSDVRSSVPWYRALLDAELAAEFVEDGVVQGAAVRVPGSDFVIALRNREVCASRPVLDGFDVVAIEIDSRESLAALLERCDHLGIVHGSIEERQDGAVLDVRDPDGTVIRFYHRTGDREDFVGYTFSGGAFAGTYGQPRLVNWLS